MIRFCWAYSRKTSSFMTEATVLPSELHEMSIGHIDENNDASMKNRMRDLMTPPGGVIS